MSAITNLPSIWRQGMLPASFNGALFHCEANGRASGRRIALHQFPKKDLPYAEDMGRDAREFTIRGYCIVFPYDRDNLRTRDYRQPRDALIRQLEAEGPGTLQPADAAVADRGVPLPNYRVTEEERFGGYCVIDMTFREYGANPTNFAPDVATDVAVDDASQQVRDQVQQSLAPEPVTGKLAGPI